MMNLRQDIEFIEIGAHSRGSWKSPASRVQARWRNSPKDGLDSSYISQRITWKWDYTYCTS